ncbi:bifunctional D-glycero-beta-D-manno-heptose-7-phosphate kinase/D-glycero-beta-D-manno-heptose 1-phosphate adenylyltransferase HldE [Desulfurobacterium atlanticum]|uniref:Bifunctional protein HldE n=1 Tax=Desulfurobacterium atlanticum TaxID=240169 RepID=A0A238XR06_9BACT|nr:bifunctional D-glycero-beta-D-manno-heptose-7-phosphate kinase/D-glycero-beta-D-manno-heptose 1-phosphate adenylyltransferase HldE [Desulfurobacterium atlanticum]SNR60774.1 D-beta-D-heptose 7-phosphate kinase / D-beta-D-heptose 1-phosphate adenosyltransferase [Desulfurobacterium atlanticum]
MFDKLDFSNASVLVLGDLMLDKYYFGNVNRISPEAPVPVVKVNREEYTLGGAGNVVNNIINLKAKAYMIGAVGEDSNKSVIKQLLDEKQVKYHLLERDLPTITKIRVVGEHQQIVRIDFEEIKHLEQEEIERVKEYILTLINKVDCLVISDYGKGMVNFELSQFVINQAREKNLPVIVDPKGNDWSKYKGATIITPNLKELSDLLKIEIRNDDKEIETYGQEVREKYNLKYLLVTRSEKGMSLIAENEVHHIRSEAKEVYDVSGAGDTVVATLATAISAGINISDAIKIANTAAGIVVRKIGTAPITLDELKNALKVYRNRKLRHLQDLIVEIAMLREKGKKIVFTNGCFDILHRGHIEYLKKAKELGDVLIVGLNSDDSVKRIKGKDRPINRQEDRAELLASLEFVDYVVIFDEDTPYNLIKEIKPHVLVKGGDYKLEEIVGREFAKKTITLPFIEGYSTTFLIEKMRNR